MNKRVVKTFADLVTGDVVRFTHGAYGDMTITEIVKSNLPGGGAKITAFRAYVHFDDSVDIAYIGHEWVRDMLKPLNATLEQYGWKLVEQVSDTEINLRVTRQNPRLAKEFTDQFHNTDNSDNLSNLAAKIIAAGGSKGR